MRAFRYVLSGAALIVLAACKDTLLVDNQNQADRNRALGTFTDLEAFLGSGYATAHNAVLAGSNDDLQTQMLVMGLENISGLANFAMGPRGAVPRVQIDNQPNGTGDAGNLRDFTFGHRAARIASLVLPTPPGPARLTRRASVSFFLTSASSRRRPTKLVASAGMLPARRAGLAMTRM